MPSPPFNFEVVASDNVLPLHSYRCQPSISTCVSNASVCGMQLRTSESEVMPTGILCYNYLTTVLEMFYISLLCQTKSFVTRLIGSIMDCFSEMVKEVRRKAGWNSVKHGLS